MEEPGLRTDDLLSLLIGAIVIDTIIIAMNYARVIFISDELTRWYTTFRISAMAMDVLIIVLYATAGIRLARRIDKNASAYLEIVCILLIQLMGDVLFYLFFEAVPSGTLVFDIFKDYASEVKYHALWSDALMMLFTYAIANALCDASLDTKTLCLIVVLYVSQYILFLK